MRGRFDFVYTIEVIVCIEENITHYRNSIYTPELAFKGDFHKVSFNEVNAANQVFASSV